MPDINGIPYVDSSDLVSAYPATSLALAQEVSDQLGSKLPYSYGTATPSTTTDGFLWFDENDTPPTPKFWDGAAFQALTSGKILQVVRATDSTDRTTTSTSFADTGLSITITPQKSDSAIILITTGRGQTSAANTQGGLQITDSSNNGISGAEHFATQSSGLFNFGYAIIGYATPATTSATTYKLRFNREVTGTFSIFNSSMTGQLFAIEVSA